MGIAKGRRTRLVVADRLFLWYVADGDDGRSWGPILHVISEDKRFAILSPVAQPGEPFVVVMGREFPGLADAGGVWIRVRRPRFDGEGAAVEPGFVRQLVEWCLDGTKPISRVDYRGELIF